ncbi:hypothetical protein BC628DRAFT_1344832 [Trametes gibbosa]|nr:hypothetical protein BC628DRAFT_1344832 [Trametes gibbosa]
MKTRVLIFAWRGSWTGAGGGLQVVEHDVDAVSKQQGLVASCQGPPPTAVGSALASRPWGPLSSFVSRGARGLLSPVASWRTQRSLPRN